MEKPILSAVKYHCQEFLKLRTIQSEKFGAAKQSFEFLFALIEGISTRDDEEISTFMAEVLKTTPQGKEIQLLNEEIENLEKKISAHEEINAMFGESFKKLSDSFETLSETLKEINKENIDLTIKLNAKNNGETAK